MRKFSEVEPNIMLCSFVVWVCVFLCFLFPLFGIGLSFFVCSFLSIGFKKNVIDILQSKNIKIEGIFSYFKYCLSSFCLSACTLFLVFIWSLALLIPGIIVGVNYSFAPFIFAENPELGVIKCLEQSKQKTIGHRVEIFIMYLVQMLFIVLIAIFGCCSIIILNYFAPVPNWLYYTVPIIVSLFLYYVVIYPYFEMYLADLYLSQNIQPKTKRKKKVYQETKSDEKVVA